MAETQLSEEALQARRDYVNNWRKNNPEKVKQYRRNYWERKAAEMKSEDK